MSEDIVARLRAVHCTGFEHDVKSDFIAFKCFVPWKQLLSVEELGRRFAAASRIHHEAADAIELLRKRISELEAERPS